MANILTERGYLQENEYIQNGAYHRKQPRRSSTIARYNTVIGEMGDVSGLRVLDFGGGDGALASMLADRGARVTVFDISSTALRYAQQDVRLETVCGSEPSQLGRRQFDVIVASEVIEHLSVEDEKKALVGLYGVGVIGTKLIVTVPSASVPVSAKHYDHYSLNGDKGRNLILELENVGFDINRAYAFNMGPFSRFRENWINNAFVQKIAHKLAAAGNWIYRELHHNRMIECSESEAEGLIAVALIPDGAV